MKYWLRIWIFSALLAFLLLLEEEEEEEEYYGDIPATKEGLKQWWIRFSERLQNKTSADIISTIRETFQQIRARKAKPITTLRRFKRFKKITLSMKQLAQNLAQIGRDVLTEALTSLAKAS